MLYKLLIVDDESVIRECLNSLFDWKSMGYEVVALFKDGSEAISYIKENPVDIVLSDIKMDYVNGLELAEYIYKNLPDIKIILMSAYKEFEFARQALKFNVEHYILKPMDIKELRTLLCNIKEQLDEKYRKKLQADNMRMQFEYVIPLLQRQLILDIAMGALNNEEEIKNRLKLLEMDIDADKDICCKISCCISGLEEHIKRNWQYTKESLQRELLKRFHVFISDVRYITLSLNENEISLIAISSANIEEYDLKNRIINFLNETKNDIKINLNLSIEYNIENNFSTLRGLYSMKSAIKENAVDLQDIIKNNSVIFEKQKLLICYINSGNIEKVLSIFDAFFNELKAFDLKIIKNFAIDLFSMLNNKLKEIGINLFSFKGLEFTYNDILEMNSYEEVLEWGHKILNEVNNFMMNSTDYSSKQMIKRAKLYVMEHFAEDITLDDVASFLYLNPVYFSRLFKDSTGENFTDYLTEIRMKQAMELLHNSKNKVYEISPLVGYKSVQYFYKLFKQYTGYTPNEYRNMT